MINISHPLYLHVADQEGKRHSKSFVVLSLKVEGFGFRVMKMQGFIIPNNCYIVKLLLFHFRGWKG